MTGNAPQVVSVSDVDNPIPILIVEDEALVAAYIGEVLQELGFAVAGIASSGPEALSLAAEHAPALALVDIRLPGPMDGIEIARRLQNVHRVPAIFLSGVADPEIEERAKSVLPAGFLRKPFRPSQVFNAIEEVLRSRSRPAPQ
jgi:two-component system, response regulator PdtaR